MKPIHHTFAPHVDAKYVRWALLALLNPLAWRKGSGTADLAATLGRWFEGECTLFFSGREALLALFNACEFEHGSEIVIQGYTCVALPNAIHAAGYTPIYVDTDPQTLNLDTDSLKSKITHRTKAIICQHTFGMVADTVTLRDIADQHNLMLIEDCAHIIPDVTGPKSIGKQADAIMVSFGRDKAASGITGGALITKHPSLTVGVAAQADQRRHVSPLTVARLLMYPLLYGIARPIYTLGGKALLWIAGKIGLLIPVLTGEEKQGHQPTALRHMPNACAGIVRKQLRFFHSLNNHRRLLTAKYIAAAKEYSWNVPRQLSEHFPLQKFPIYVADADAVRAALKTKNIYLDDAWTGAAVCPRNVDQEAAGYLSGTCPRAERIDREILCLPTHPTMTEQQADKLIRILKTTLT